MKKLIFALVYLFLAVPCAAGIITVDDNGPADFNNIQAAINVAVDGDIIIVATGTYIGPGNRDIDFLSKAITVRSTDPNDPNITTATIIDCNSLSSYPRPIPIPTPYFRGFYFNRGEDANSIVSGFTITNGIAIVCNESSPTINNCAITGNAPWGGIVCHNSRPKIIYCTITGNSASLWGGGIYCSDSYPIINSCTITSNSPSGICCRDNSSPTIINCTITGNSGGIYCNNSSPTIINCTITGNSGGGIYCLDNSSPAITNCTITGNSVELDGGGIYCETDSNATISNCTITNNSASRDGGGIYCNESSPTISNCTVTGNSTKRDGGGIHCSTSSPTITDCNIIGNSADRGGNIFCDNSSPTIMNCIITGNGLSYSGLSTIHCDYKSSPIITGCIIRDSNTIGIYCGSGIPIITNCTIRNNNNSGIFCRGNPIINNCTISGNSADRGGGIYCYYHSSPTITDCNISGNSANHGGGIWGCSGPITNCTINYNSANYLGGGIFECDGPITNCIITGNSANVEGGGLDGCGGPIKNCTITGNSAKSGGGLLACDGSITNCTIANNSASNYGGLAYCRGPIKNSIIWSNWPDQIVGRIITITCSDVQGGYPGEGNIDADPCFIEHGYWVDANDPNIIVEPNDPNAVWLDGDYRLLFNSPCIDTGDPNYMAEPNETDLDGNPRVFDGNRDGTAVVDMGAYEYQNTPPVAVAGPNQSVYAWLDGFADVALVGSASYDDDNDVLDYYWSWTINGNTYEANGINPTIKLPVGIHTIELVVDDGIDLSEADYCTITVIKAIRGRLMLSPNVLQTKSHGKWIIATLFIPPVPGEKVNTTMPLRLYPGGIEAKYQRISRYGFSRFAPSLALAFFDRQQVIDALGPGRFEVDVVGKFLSGRYFFGSDTIRIIAPPPRPKPPPLKPPRH
jgi:parallel beta-helix repeat protein